MIEKRQCCVRVSDSSRFMGSHSCTKPAIVEFGGKLYCKIHDPAAVKKRDDESARRHKEKWEREAKYELARAYRLVAEDIKANHELQCGTTLGWMLSTLSTLERALETDNGNL